MFMQLFSAILATIGAWASTVGSQACLLFFWDEEEMPKSLVK